MSEVRDTAASPTWVKPVLWSLAVGTAIVGVLAAIATGSLFPLLATAGLALPLIQARRRSAAGARPVSR